LHPEIERRGFKRAKKEERMKTVYGIINRWSSVKIEKAEVERETAKMYYFKKGHSIDYCGQKRKEDLYNSLAEAKKMAIDFVKTKIERKRKDIESLERDLARIEGTEEL
jgi:hypothetical protein